MDIGKRKIINKTPLSGFFFTTTCETQYYFSIYNKGFETQSSQ